MKRTQDTPLQPRSLSRLHFMKVPTMVWRLLLLELLAYGSGVDSQTVVTQEPSLSVSPGGTVTLTCGLSSGSVSTGNKPGWYQHTPGQAPCRIIYDTSSHPSGVPDRFSGSISENKTALTITEAQPEDEADYIIYEWWCLHSDLNLWGSAAKTSSWPHP
ncbi:immunoglobulin lambda variable 8-61-like isoform X3 [Canis lupus familiaris]|uniref:Ig-like domain-containing protein n=2 Tax=Canis lupus familiaris TaxID=9615 RepID=A0A8C0TVE4_CANLF|nr:immunoglobulin lambda variable 8-61-like isoform X3 [Canis lupus familiaris]